MSVKHKSYQNPKGYEHWDNYYYYDLQRLMSRPDEAYTTFSICEESEAEAVAYVRARLRHWNAPDDVIAAVKVYRWDDPARKEIERLIPPGEDKVGIILGNLMAKQPWKAEA
jgi:hypothetical protein